MTTSTLFSTVSENQNQAGQPFVPANTVVDTGGTTRPFFTLTVTPSTGWAKAEVAVSADNSTFLPLGEIYSAPTGGGTITHTMHPPPTARRYFSATAFTVSPGATATLTMTY